MGDYSQEDMYLARKRAAIRRRKELREKRKKRIIFLVVLGLAVISTIFILAFSADPNETEDSGETKTASASAEEESSKGNSREGASSEETSSFQETASSEEMRASTTGETDSPETESTEETSESPSEEQPDTGGKLIYNEIYSDVLSLSNKSVPYGNDWEQKEEKTGLAEGIFWYESVYGKYGGLYRIKTDEKVIYLTMDEGYEAGYTGRILDILKEKKVKAVFFITKQFYDYCQEEGHEDLIRRMIEEGHIIGNHTCLHPGMGSDYATYGLTAGGYPNYLNYLVATGAKTEEEALQVFVEDLQKLHQLVYDTYGYTMTLFRFPEGEASERLMATCKNYGYTPVYWSYAHRDYNLNDQPEVSVTLDRCLSHLAKGSIYLLHAVSSSNTAALSDFIDQAREAGYSFGVFPAE